MSDWDTFLERLAGEVCIRYVQCTGYPLPRVDEIHPDTIKTMTHVLRAKLFPLLEAGQAMRDEAPSILGKPWDSAKEAKGGQVSEPNVTEGDEVMVRATVIDAHWADKKLYKVRVTKVTLPLQSEAGLEVWVHDKDMRRLEEA